ncbi:UDP-glucose dehydrogenase family protein [Allomesorhizobium alhagi]|uniref:UDP-glucose 6-dehydrogenase n=1 Tax=Mesorhizobium alhagi CCNWXJ12-2 TaxID=1107882 RepID=H0HYQ2_9HYPH|nr:UDP-glucose/GDP-mannose dehydrogenase family protein [Mesorhizobium alhagi]EHK54124.1 nucleotide sugar dehydrogenase [Mesorhizobium alhagi CCNWXJ12-2]
MKITIFGTGYVGLVQAAVMAESGYDVVCVDVDAAKIARLACGEMPIFEPGLERLVRDNHAAGRLHFTTDAAEGVLHATIQFIAVGTPPDEDGSADLNNVLAVGKAIAATMDGHRIVVAKSTVPVGTCDKISKIMKLTLAETGRKDLTFDVASNPEFLKEGSAVADCMKPDRIVIGTSNRETEAVLRELYAPFNRNHEKIIVMDVRSAELTKYAANCMLATKITFMNEMANLAEALGADIERVRQGIGSDPRIGYQFIYPGVGYGGSCFPKDVRALIHIADRVAYDAKVLTAVDEQNRKQKSVLFHKILKHFGGDITGKVFALWGLAFKPNTDDMREAPSRTIMEALWQAGAKVQAFDPEAMRECRRIYGERHELVLSRNKEAALIGADALVIVTEWKAFLGPDFEYIKKALTHSVIFDGRNLYDPEVVSRYDLDYHSIGRVQFNREQPTI